LEVAQLPTTPDNATFSYIHQNTPDNRINNNYMKRKLTTEKYQKMGHPDLGNTIYFVKDGKRVYGRVSLLSFCGFKGAKKGLVLLGIDPFKRFKNQDK